MTAQANNLAVIENWRKQKVSPTNSSTDAISIAEIQESIEHVMVQSELIAEQNRKIIDSLESLNKKVYEPTTTMTVKVSETIVQPRVRRLSAPVQFFLKLMELWHLDSEDACKLLGYELADIKYVEQVLSGELPLRGCDPKDRIANLVVIRKRLDGLFKNVDVENEWLREKQVDIGNKSPMELLLSGSMENLLLVKQFVEFICGL